MAEGKSLRRLLAATIESGPGRAGFKAAHLNFIEMRSAVRLDPATREPPSGVMP